MLTLISYMDETGHSDNPNIEYVGMAGFVAPLGVWEIFTERWRNTLDNAGLREPFHMKDFAHSRGQFKDWSGKKEERKRLFGRLMEIITETKATPVGAIVSLKDFRSLTSEQQRSFLDPYYIAFQTCTRGAALEAEFEPPEEEVKMVYAFQSEFGGRAKQLWHAMKESIDVGPRMGAYGVGTPAEEIPLQVADIFAYELSKEFENRIKRPNDKMRHGLKQILKMVRVRPPRICIFDRKELLRRIKEGRFPDQTYTEDVDDNQMFSAMERLTRWLSERGELTDDDFDI